MGKLSLFILLKDTIICVIKLNRGAATDEERCQMQDSGRIYIGDMINTIRHGSLVRQHLGETTAQVTGSLLFGTVCGAVGKPSTKGSVFSLTGTKNKIWNHN